MIIKKGLGAGGEGPGKIKIIFGLGNPGKEFEHTYHNAGILALEALLGLEGASETTPFKAYKNLFEYVKLGDMSFARSLTYMNESGSAVREALKKFKLKPEELLVMQDDSDITVGNYKISFARSSAGHRGIQSVIDALHTNRFLRARIGIRPQAEIKRKKAGDFALKQITQKDSEILTGVFAKLNEKIIEGIRRNKKDLSRQHPSS